MGGSFLTRAPYLECVEVSSLWENNGMHLYLENRNGGPIFRRWFIFWIWIVWWAIIVFPLMYRLKTIYVILRILKNFWRDPYTACVEVLFMKTNKSEVVSNLESQGYQYIESVQSLGKFSVLKDIESFYNAICEGRLMNS